MKLFIKIICVITSILLFGGVLAGYIDRMKVKKEQEQYPHISNGIYEKYLKRSLDFILSGMALILLSPVMLILTIVVKWKLGSPVIFKQERIGKNNKKFYLYKYRTMTNEKNSEGELLPDEVRLTEFGRMLRSTSLDELPELVNILKGDMSLVGPRPLLVKYLDRYNAEQIHRHDVRSGLTGLAQINGRNAISWDERFADDVKYVGDITFLGDCRILLNTIGVVLGKRGINSETNATMEEFMGSENVECEKSSFDERKDGN